MKLLVLYNFHFTKGETKSLKTPLVANEYFPPASDYFDFPKPLFPSHPRVFQWENHAQLISLQKYDFKTTSEKKYSSERKLKLQRNRKM